MLAKSLLYSYREFSQRGTADEGIDDCETPIKKRKVYEECKLSYCLFCYWNIFFQILSWINSNVTNVTAAEITQK